MRLWWVVLSSMMCISGMMAGPAVAGTSDKPLSPYFYVEGAEEGIDDFPLKDTAVKATISGVIADVWVRQSYANQGSRPINARYVFPASTRAAVHGMRMTVGEDVIEAQIKEREEARTVFSQAKAAGKSASLLEQQRPNVFSMDVANIMPGESVSVELHYSELLVPEEGMYEFVYPTVVGPRYSTIPEAGAADHHQWVRNPYFTSDQAPTSTFNMRVVLSTGLPIQKVACETHDTAVIWDSDAQARIELAPAETHGGNRDFILNYRLAGDRIHSGLLLHEGEKENFFLFMVQPPQRVPADAMPPREYIFVLDVSGSMHGFPLDTAKELMRELLSGLRSQDSFNVILFSGAARVLAEQSVAASDAQIQAAMALIDDQQGGGGTELSRALKTGLQLPHDPGVARTMVVVTDGYIAAEKEVFGLVADQAGQCNFFAFGIGGSVNRYLIEGLAHAGQGEPFVVTDPQDAPATAACFRKYIEAPVLTDIQVMFDDFEAYDVEPLRQADLFAARPLVICGKWRGPLQGAVRVTGITGSGPYEAEFDLTPALSSPDAAPALPYLWARKRLERLSDLAAGQPDEENRRQVTDLGLQYAMLTAYTSFVAVHDTVRNTAEAARDVDQPLPLPQHVSDLAVGTHNVPEPEIMAVLACMLAAGLLAAWRRGRRNHPGI